MIINGNLHSSGAVIADYLAAQKENDAEPELFAVRGTFAKEPKAAILEMDAYKKLSKARHGLYHFRLNPDPSEMMNKASWQFSIDTALNELGCKDQPYVAYPHTKKGREHMHVVVQRFHVKDRKMITFSQSYRKHDQARKIIEITLGHKRTPVKDKARHKKLREDMTHAWHSTTNAKDFIREAGKMGYTIARGGKNRPYQVVGRFGEVTAAYDLVRSITGAKTQDVRNRLNDAALPTDKIALDTVRFKATAKKQANKEQFDKYSEDVRQETERERLAREMREQQENLTKPKGMRL